MPIYNEIDLKELLSMLGIGLIINPVAGIGGSVALKGSDGQNVLEKALSLGAKPQAQKRARMALAELEPIRDNTVFYTYGGDMGETILMELGYKYEVVGTPNIPTTANDTMEAARLIVNAGAELVMFAGGDGTARDICTAIGETVPVIGIPAGVKIHSAVYALNPRNAGLAALEYLRTPAGTATAEVMDIDEESFRAGRVMAKLYGYMTIPAKSLRMQSTKSPNSSDEDELFGIAGYIVDNMEPGVIYLIGPGSTTRYITNELNLQGTLLGVDVVRDGKLLIADATEPAIWALLEGQTAKVKLIVTIIGGQGMLFGRGNQQFSPRILRRVGRNNIIIAATHSKLRQLEGRPLCVDTGDEALDAELSDYMDVIVEYDQSVFYKISN